MGNVLTNQTSSKTTSIVSIVALLIFLPLLILATYQTVILISRAAGVSADIVVDTKAVLEPISTDFYHAFSQGGEESTDMLAPVVSQIRSLRPKLIRLDHIYDHYNVVGRSGNDLTFDWTKLDAALNTIAATGAKPFIALSYMPQVIARDGNIVNPPNNWNEWAMVVTRTIEHISGRGGKNLSGVYYEVWNEPDLDQFGKWTLGGDKNYLTLYQYAALGARRANNSNGYYFGGPATTGLYKNWILALVNSGMRIDFFSWHSYLADPKQFTEDQKNIITWLLPTPSYALLPRIISEFGFTGNKSTAYGGTYAAAHTAAVIRQLISGGPKYLMSFQLKDGPGQESGNGWGLITHESNGKKAKPRYYIFNYLDSMTGNRLGLTGEGTWVTGFSAINDKTIRLLLVNYDAGGAHVENVPVSFTKLDNGDYLYREHALFGRDITTKLSVTDGTSQHQVFMPAQSMVILELTKQ